MSNRMAFTPGGSPIEGATAGVSAPTNVAPLTTETFIECNRSVAPIVSCVTATPPPLGPKPSGFTAGASDEYACAAYVFPAPDAARATMAMLNNVLLIISALPVESPKRGWDEDILDRCSA